MNRSSLALSSFIFVALAYAQATATAPLRTITVIGEGKVRVQPDIARVTFGAEVLRPQARRRDQRRLPNLPHRADTA